MAGEAFEWRLREVMAHRQLWHTSQLQPLLAERGFELSRSQVYRLVAQPPGRISVELILALCDILDCRFEDLVVRTTAVPASGPAKRRRKAAGETNAFSPKAKPVPDEFFDDQT